MIGLTRLTETYFWTSPATDGSSLLAPSASSGIGFRMPYALIVADPAKAGVASRDALPSAGDVSVTATGVESTVKATAADEPAFA